jgi:hypothetical protein
MAYEVAGMKLGVLPAGEDLSAAQFLFVKVNASSQIVKCTVSGESPDGVLQSKVASGQPADVDRNGVSKVVAGPGGITAGNDVTTNASGQAITAASGDFIAGRCILSAASGAFGTVSLTRSGKK